jgi:hypothetical protein
LLNIRACLAIVDVDVIGDTPQHVEIWDAVTVSIRPKGEPRRMLKQGGVSRDEEPEIALLLDRSVGDGER